MTRSTRKTSQQDPFDSRQWQSQSTITAKAALAKVAKAGSGAPPPPPGVSLTVTPGILCCGAGKKIAATATATGPGAKNADVTLCWPGGCKPGKGSVSQTYTVTEADCGTVLEFSGTANGVTKEAKVPVVKIKTTTYATVPADWSRKKLGVCEQNLIDLTPMIGAVKWQVVGKGSLSSNSAHTTTFTAPDRAGETTIKGTLKTTAEETVVPKEITCSVTFKILEPSGVKMEPAPGSSAFHVNGLASAGFCATVYILPEDVCFNKIIVQ